TAASIGFVTVIGLCFGSGEIGLGLAGTALAMIILWALKWLEKFIPREHRAVLVLRASPVAPEGELDRALESAGIAISSRSIAFAVEPRETRLEWALRWRSRGKTAAPPGFLGDFAQRADILSLEWRTQDPAR